MNLPDFMAYKDKFTQSAFVEKISHVAKRAGAKMVYAALILYYTLESDKVALKDKAMIIGALVPHQSARCDSRCHSDSGTER